MPDVKSITVFGATGSIGSSTLSLVREHPIKFRVHALSAYKDAVSLAALAREFMPKYVIMVNEASYIELKSLLAGLDITVLCGAKALIDIARHKVDLVVAGIVGLAGLPPVHAAIEAGQNIALANKETLVSAGHLLIPLSAQTGAKILPVDSEHNAIFQCIRHESSCDIEQIILTASGGPFRQSNAEQMAQATVEEALRHPRWSMGPKVSIDSATLMNKGLELIEAAKLFEISPSAIDAVIHPQSVIHGLVSFHDGTWLAHLGIADMRVPISHALGYPYRLAWQAEKLNLTDIARFDFEPIDLQRFPCYALAKAVMGGEPEEAIILNAANEIAVQAFLEGKIGFSKISAVVEGALAAGSEHIKADSLEAIISLDDEIRERELHQLNS